MSTVILPSVEPAEEHADAKITLRLRLRIVELIVLISASIIVLALLGAAPVLILAVLAFGAILGIFAAVTVLIVGGRI